MKKTAKERSDSINVEADPNIGAGNTAAQADLYGYEPDSNGLG